MLESYTISTAGLEANLLGLLDDTSCPTQQSAIQ